MIDKEIITSVLKWLLDSGSYDKLEIYNKHIKVTKDNLTINLYKVFIPTANYKMSYAVNNSNDIEKTEKFTYTPPDNEVCRINSYDITEELYNSLCPNTTYIPSDETKQTEKCIEIFGKVDPDKDLLLSTFNSYIVNNNYLKIYSGFCKSAIQINDYVKISVDSFNGVYNVSYFIKSIPKESTDKITHVVDFQDTVYKSFDISIYEFNDIHTKCLSMRKFTDKDIKDKICKVIFGIYDKAIESKIKNLINE